MTKEQEAIERLNSFKTIKILYGNTFAMSIEQLKTVQKDLETALNMLKNMEKQEENYKNLIADVSMIAKELGLEEDGTIDEIYEKIKEKDKEIEKKDKIIDLMAERIEWLCKINGILLDKKHDENFTQEDIKQYFKQKATEMLQKERKE